LKVFDENQKETCHLYSKHVDNCIRNVEHSEVVEAALNASFPGAKKGHVVEKKVYAKL
jgi:hypothetical protein